VTSESKPVPPHVLTVPVAGPSLEFRQLVVEHFLELGESGGETVWWRPIASPTLCDPIYESLRTPEMERRDREEADEYAAECERAGGEEMLLRREYAQLAKNHGIELSERPSLLVIPIPDCGFFAKLPLSPDAFGTPNRRRELVCFLQQEFSESRIKEFTFDGVFDEDSINRLQEHCDRIAKVVADSIAADRGLPERMWNSYLKLEGLIEQPDPAGHTKVVAWRKAGSIFLETHVDDVHEGTVEFALQEGRVTHQMTLIWLLLLNFPDGMHFDEIAKELYPKEHARARTDCDKALLLRISKRVRTLIHDIRCKKLEPAGINPAILPPVRKHMKRKDSYGMQLKGLDRARVGHLRRSPR